MVKRSIRIAGRLIDVNIEGDFWTSLDEIAKLQAAKTSSLVIAIDAGRHGARLSSAIRAYVLEHYLMKVRSPEDIDEGTDGAGQIPVGGPINGIARPRWLN